MTPEEVIKGAFERKRLEAETNKLAAEKAAKKTRSKAKKEEQLVLAATWARREALWADEMAFRKKMAF